MSRLLFALLAAGVVSQASAQTGDTTITSGRRIWIHQPGTASAPARNLKGIFEGWVGDSLRMLPDRRDTSVTLLRGDRTDLYVSTGKGSRSGDGAKLGFILGGALGFMLAVGSGDDYVSDGSIGYGLRASASMGLVGALVGALVGGGIKHDRWVQIGRPRAVALRIMPRPGGAGVGIVLRL